jgi:hypothetical protein
VWQGGREVRHAIFGDLVGTAWLETMPGVEAVSRAGPVTHGHNRACWLRREDTGQAMRAWPGKPGVNATGVNAER